MGEDYRAIDYEVTDGIATITLDRPDHMNAFTVRMCLEMIDALDRIDSDPDVRVVIVTGSGRAFCAGADLSGGADTFDASGSSASAAASELAASADPERGADVESPAERSMRRPIDPRRDLGGLLTLRLFETTKPVIAAINGAAVGVGATMTLPMDLRLASEKARFGFVFAARGIVPDACSSWFLPRLVGVQQALEWCYTARVFPASEALESGLIRSIHAPVDLLPAARALAGEIAAGIAPVSATMTRQLLWQGLVADHPMQSHRVESPGVLATGAGADAREGITAFFEKRPASWHLRVPGDLPDWFPWWEEPSFDP